MNFHTVVTLINGRLTDGQVDVNHLADILGVSTRRLHLFFLEHSAMCPKHFLESMRLKQAVVLLANDMALQDICACTGYACTKTLRNAFKRRLGTTPTRIRQHLADTGSTAQLLEHIETQLFTEKALALLQQYVVRRE